MGNAKMAPVSASLGGTASIALWKGAPIAALRMDNAGLILRALGNAAAMGDGTGKIAACSWNRVAAMEEIMTKVQSLYILIGGVINVFFCKDGLVDCEDPECCSNHLCRSSQLCVSAPKPIDILLRKQPPAITASFFERMKFLIDEGSLQNYARQETFNER